MLLSPYELFYKLFNAMYSNEEVELFTSKMSTPKCIWGLIDSSMAMIIAMNWL